MDTVKKEQLTGAGIDVDGALERLMGSETLLERFLIKFLSDPNFEKLEHAVAAEDPEGAVHAAHTLKGVCGNLSMHILYDLLTRQVDAFRGGDWAAAVGLMDAVRPAYVELVEAIRRVYGDGRP